jgi:hypothetical protein
MLESRNSRGAIILFIKISSQKVREDDGTSEEVIVFDVQD